MLVTVAALAECAILHVCSSDMSQAHRCCQVLWQDGEALDEDGHWQQHEEGHDGDDLEQVHVVQRTLYSTTTTAAQPAEQQTAQHVEKGSGENPVLDI
jgi:hypothetical protein